MSSNGNRNVCFGEVPVAFGRGTLKVCRRHQSILLVALHRPKLFNAFNDDVYEDLIAVLDFVEQDPSLAALVITGTGPYFSSGADLKTGQHTHFQPESTGRQTRRKPAGRFMLALIRFPKILAAAVNGPAVGIAVTLLLHCDLVHVGANATLWAPFTRLALVPELCSSVTFMESHGLSKANELLLLGRKIDADTALDWNICSRVVDAPGVSDPFSPDSLASRMSSELSRRLLQLPLGNRTATYFCGLVKGARRSRMEAACLAELEKLDERFDTGQVAQAASHIQFGSLKNKKRSKL